MRVTRSVNDTFKLEGLKQFKTFNTKELFERGHFRVVTAYPMAKEIRLVLQNTNIRDDNEENLVFVRLENSGENSLPIEVMRGGQKISFEDLLEIEKAVIRYGSIYITVSKIRVGDFVLSSGDELEWAENLEQAEEVTSSESEEQIKKQSKKVASKPKRGGDFVDW